MTTQVPRVTMLGGVDIPQLGFGVFQVPNDVTAETVRTAIEVGYRSIDTAAMYQNEEGVGAAIASSDVPREDLFITTKLQNSDHGYDSALKAFDTSLGKLGLDYVDLYLIHWPRPAADEYVDTWRAFERIHNEGRARAIGVSNFQPAHLRRLLDETDTTPALNQIELHPNLQQEDLRAFHAKHGIVTEAWSPLAKGGELLADPVITRLAETHEKTPAQVVLRWHLQLGNVVIPKSQTPSRIASNFDVFDFALSNEDLAAIAGLDRGARTGPDPDTFG